MQIKTLAEILAESDNDSASSTVRRKKRHTKQQAEPSKPTKTELFTKRKLKKELRLKSESIDDNPSNPYYETRKSADISVTEDSYTHYFSDSISKADKSESNKSTSDKSNSKKRKKRFHPAAHFIAEPNNAPVYVAPETQSIKQMLAEVKHEVHNTHVDTKNHHVASNKTNQTAATDYIETLTAGEVDNLPSALKAYLRTPEQKQAEIDAIKAESRLRWLAFYYLSRREYGKAELKQKLIDKEQDPDRIDALLDEFEDKGYQSDYRTTLMLIRENIRKGRGRERIKQEFYKKKIAMPDNIDELIDMANTESEEFNEFVDENEDSLIDGVDWLKLAVEARTKKYGDDIPTEQKDKAKQLRFLQYRGFKSDICFQALNYTIETLEDRF